MLQRKVQEKKASVRPKNRVEGASSRNGKEQIRLKEVRARSEKGPKKQSEWIKVNGGENKKVV